MNILFIGDIIGLGGRNALKAHMRSIVEKEAIEFIIVNGENAAGGFGITEQIARELFDYGVHVITTGNHVWDKKEIIGYVTQNDRLLRPLNYPPGVPGFGSVIYYLKNGVKIGVINLMGRIFMAPVDCPFRTSIPEIERIQNETNVIIVDFHAEATSEKIAYAHYVNGKVSAVCGTHTHVQTADERILSKGTAFITDVGMTGPYDSIIGIKEEQIIERFLTFMPNKYDVAKGRTIFSAVVLDVDHNTGKTYSIKRIMLVSEQK
ncbi:MAG: TIGR00282 family metallophosphoesterase [Candidatus Magnetoovum sp. WYHC-5]|nr:TIGR00282 family metallophosphoesterase [Candidatus Magnetoovum sp. WYHC-5]